LARISDRIESRLPLLAAESFEFGDRRWCTDVTSKHRDVNVFRETADQAEAFGQGGAALEEKTGAAVSEAMKQGIERPADPKVLLDILGCRVETRRSGVEGAEHRVGTSRQHLIKRRIHAPDIRLEERPRDAGLANASFARDRSTLR
jgi:hypothetical protein